MMSQKKADKIIKQTANIYDKIAPHFAATREKLWPEISAWRKYLQAGDRVLDAGCGSGRLLQLFSDLNIAYYGVDISSKLLEIAKRNSQHYKLSEVHWQQASLISLPLSDNFFDKVFCVATWQHIPSRAYRFQAVSEIYRVLRPGGMLFMTNWYLWNKWANKKYKITRQIKLNWIKGLDRGDVLIPWKDSSGIVGKRYYHAFTKPEIKTILEQAGFIVEQNFLSYSDERQTRENIVTIAIKPV